MKRNMHHLMMSSIVVTASIGYFPVEVSAYSVVEFNGLPKEKRTYRKHECICPIVDGISYVTSLSAGRGWSKDHRIQPRAAKSARILGSHAGLTEKNLHLCGDNNWSPHLLALSNYSFLHRRNRLYICVNSEVAPCYHYGICFSNDFFQLLGVDVSLNFRKYKSFSAADPFCLGHILAG